MISLLVARVSRRGDLAARVAAACFGGREEADLWKSTLGKDAVEVDEEVRYQS